MTGIVHIYRSPASLWGAFGKRALVPHFKSNLNFNPWNSIFAGLHLDDRTELHSELTPAAPRADILESDTGFTVTVEVPGVPHSDLSVSLDQGQVLKISGKTRHRRHHDGLSHPQSETVNSDSQPDSESGPSSRDENFSRHSESSFSLSYALRSRHAKAGHHAALDEANIQAKLENGLLEIYLPKVAPPKPRVTPIPVQLVSGTGSGPTIVTASHGDGDQTMTGGTTDSNLRANDSESDNHDATITSRPDNLNVPETTSKLDE